MTESVPRFLPSSSDPLADGLPADPLDFVPLPCRASNGWTAARQRGFIAALGELGLVGAAAGAVGMSRQSAYRLRARAAARGAADAVGAGFVAAWDAAIDQGETEALSLALDRAVNGVDEPYFYGGRQRGVRRRYAGHGCAPARHGCACVRRAKGAFGRRARAARPVASGQRLNRCWALPPVTSVTLGRRRAWCARSLPKPLPMR